MMGDEREEKSALLFFSPALYYKVYIKEFLFLCVLFSLVLFRSSGVFHMWTMCQAINIIIYLLCLIPSAKSTSKRELSPKISAFPIYIYFGGWSSYWLIIFKSFKPFEWPKSLVKSSKKIIWLSFFNENLMQRVWAWADSHEESIYKCVNTLYSMF